MFEWNHVFKIILKQMLQSEPDNNLISTGNEVHLNSFEEEVSYDYPSVVWVHLTLYSRFKCSKKG